MKYKILSFIITILIVSSCGEQKDINIEYNSTADKQNIVKDEKSNFKSEEEGKDIDNVNEKKLLNDIINSDVDDENTEDTSSLSEILEDTFSENGLENSGIVEILEENNAK